MLNLFHRKGSRPFVGVSLTEIARTAVCHRSMQYWHRDGTVEAATAAAQAVQHLGVEAVIDAMEHEIKQREFICDFDDPCDAWAA